MAQDPGEYGSTRSSNAHGIKRGMDDLVVDTTSISWVDGANGNLFYRGLNIGELAAHASFEETAYLLLCGRLPYKTQLASFTWKLQQLAHTPEKVLRIIQELPRTTHPLSALQVALAALGCTDPGQRFSQDESLLEKAMRIIAQTPVILAAAYRHYRNVPILAPRSDLNHSENFLFMLTGTLPSKKQARCMELALIIQMDHGFNSSTFTARAVASTLTNLYAATSAAVGALSGPLHGGASEQVVEMVKDALQQPDIEKYIIETLENKGRVMGMGHRVYKSTDPRARIFEDLLEQLTDPSEANSDLRVLREIANVARKYFQSKEMPIFVNVDFWSGAVYTRLGIHPILYPAIFAAARVVGWCAHILELRQNNRLYRPLSLYVGELNVPYVPIENRT
jgi:citrate synthase